MEKILVIGASGMLGYGVCTYFQAQGTPVVGLTRREYDIGKDPLSKLEGFLSGVSVVINCAAVIKPMISRTPIEEILKVNSIFPRNLAKVCKKEGIQCFHITTDGVYSGCKGKYTEADFCDAFDLYGLSKAAGEPTDCMTLRISIIGEEKEQARSLLSWAISQSGREVQGFLNHLWNGMTTHQFARVVDRILSAGLYQRGVFHVFSPDIVSKAALLESLNDIYGLQLRIRPVRVEPDCDRTLSSLSDLSSSVCTESIQEQIQTMKRFFNPS